MEALFNQVIADIAAYAPRVAAALAVLVVGWVVSRILAAIVNKSLHRTEIDNRVARWFAGESEESKINVEAMVSRGVFYLLMLFVLVAVFQTLGLTIVTEPLNALLNEILLFLPRVLSAALLLLVAWVIATGVRTLVKRLLTGANFEQRVRGDGEGEDDDGNLAQSISEALYWFVFLLFLPGILNALALGGMIEPARDMLSQIMAFLPNLFAALVTLIIGWFLARLVRRIATNFLAAAGLDAASERWGGSTALGDQKASEVVGTIVYVLIFIPVLISALTALGLESVTAPLTNMLNAILNAVPRVFAASLVLAVSYVLGRMVASLVSNVLAGVGINGLLEKLGIGRTVSAEDPRSPSSIVGSIILAFILLFAAMEAAGLLGFEALSTLITDFLGLAGHLVFGIILFGVGLFLANLVAQTIRASAAPQSQWLATAARVAILILAGGIALRQMGLANEIINLAFGLIVGTFAVAAAIAFGLGGRDVAAKQLEQWSRRVGSGE